MSHMPKTDAVTYLRTVAIGADRARQRAQPPVELGDHGTEERQMALRFGGNDFGCLMMEENVVSAAGTTHRTTIEEMERCIRDAGYQVRRRRQD